MGPMNDQGKEENSPNHEGICFIAAWQDGRHISAHLYVADFSSILIL